MFRCCMAVMGWLWFSVAVSRFILLLVSLRGVCVVLFMSFIHRIHTHEYIYAYTRMSCLNYVFDDTDESRKRVRLTHNM